MDRTHVVYRCFNADGEAIYVGRSSNWQNRHRDHSNATPWWSEVARVVVSGLMDRERATLIEARLIARHQPRYNIQLNPMHGPVMPHMPGRPVNRTTYTHHGCRCPACQATNAAYLRVKRARQRSAA